MRGWWNMPCWNGLSHDQQRRLIEVGNLPIGFEAEGECYRGADVCIEREGDEAPGPRFYCTPCAVAYLADGSEIWNNDRQQTGDRDGT